MVGLRYGMPIYLHGTGVWRGKKIELHCHLGALGHGAMWFITEKGKKKHPPCPGCMHGKPFKNLKLPDDEVPFGLAMKV